MGIYADRRAERSGDDVGQPDSRCAGDSLSPTAQGDFTTHPVVARMSRLRLAANMGESDLFERNGR